MSHTPGPWLNVGAVGKGVGIAAHPEGMEQPEWIAIVYGPGVNSESTANARLIVTAPNLLEAAKVQMLAYRCRQVDTDDGFPADLLAEYRAVIAKHGLKEKFHHSGNQLMDLSKRLLREAVAAAEGQ